MVYSTVVREHQLTASWRVGVRNGAPTMNGYPPSPSSPDATPRQPPARVRIVTDSASDILQSHARAIGIIVVPNRIIMDGHIFRDGIDISAAQFYARLPHARPAPYTEAASPADFYQAYQTAFAQGTTAIVSIHVSSQFSQVVPHATVARDYLAPAPIHIIDSLQLGIGMWPAVIEASRLAHLGASVRAIHERVNSLLARTHVFVMVESLEPLRRSGRIGRVQGLVGALIDAHPILTLDQGEARLVRPFARAGAPCCVWLNWRVRKRARSAALSRCSSAARASSQLLRWRHCLPGNMRA